MRTSDYDVFYGHYRPFVEAFVVRRVPEADVADLVAEVFTIAWRRREVVPADALPWLYRTARNVVGTRYRSNARLAALQQKLSAVPGEPPVDPAEVSGARDRLFRAFAALSEDDRELLLLVAWEGLENHEVAEVLGITPSTCAVRLHRARSRFEAALTSGDALLSTADASDNDVVDISAPDGAKKGRNQ